MRQTKRSAGRVGRRLQLENLERRVVLSSLPDAVLPVGQCVDVSVPVEPTPVAQVAVTDSVLTTLDGTATQDNVYRSSDGVVHVLSPPDGSAVAVRQFINYRLQSVVEVELAGSWFAFNADSVSEIQVQTSLGTPTIDVADGVTKPVLLVEPHTVDELFGHETADTLVAEAPNPLTSSTTDAVSSLLTTSVSDPIDSSPVVNAGPEGEGPPKGTGELLLPPEIIDLGYSRELSTWSCTGRVIDDKDVTGLIITFGGLLAGKKAVVNEDGYFRLLLGLPPDTSGFVTAHTVDTDGLSSDTVRILIY